jgi:hypothetical protein
VHHSEKERKALQSILDRACTDMAFRNRLLTDPCGAIFDAFGVTIPPTFRIKFIERGPGIDALVVLPDVARPAGELSDDDLESVSGGVQETAEWADEIQD